MTRAPSNLSLALMAWVGPGALLCAGSLWGQAPADTGRLTEPGQAVVIRGGWLFDGVADSRSPNEGILIRGGKFLDVDGGLGDYDLRGALVIALDDDETIMPGMFDLHGHHRVGLGSDDREETRWVPMLHLANGVTSTFPAGELDPEGMMEARRVSNPGSRSGPGSSTQDPISATPAISVPRFERTRIAVSTGPLI